MAVDHRYISITLSTDHSKNGQEMLAFIGSAESLPNNQIALRGLHLVNGNMVEKVQVYAGLDRFENCFKITELTEKEYFLGLLKMEN